MGGSLAAMGCDYTDDRNGEQQEVQVEDEVVVEKSNFFLIEHKFAEDKAKAWWSGVQEMMADAEKMKATEKGHMDAGFANLAFMPCSETVAFCVWEGKGKSVEDMTKFINENEASPTSQKDVCTNTVYAIPEELS